MAALTAPVAERGLGTERWVTLSALVAGAVGLAAGSLANALGIVTAEVALRTLRASRVLFGPEVSLRALGFDLPPLGTMLLVPLTAVPALRTTTVPAALLGAAALALAAWSLLSALRALGVGRATSLALAAAFTLQPIVLYAAAAGAGELLAAALLLLAIRLLLAWLGGGGLIPLAAAGFVLGAATMARYELVLVAMTIAAAVGPAAAVRGSARREERIANVIAFGSPIVFSLGLWLLLNALVTGNPVRFLLGGPDLAPPATAAPLVPAAAAAFLAAGMLAAAAAALPSRRLRRTVTVLAFAAGPVLVAAAVSALLPDLSPDPERGLAAVGLGTLLVGAAIVGAGGGRGPAWGAVAIAIAATLPLSLASGEQRDSGRGYARFMAPRDRSMDAMWPAERELGTVLRAVAGEGLVLVDERRDYLPAFFAGRPEVLVAAADVDVRGVLADRMGRVRFILVRTPAPSAALERSAVNRALPGLYEGRLSWAELVGTWPVTGWPGQSYRLYRVREQRAVAG